MRRIGLLMILLTVSSTASADWTQWFRRGQPAEHAPDSVAEPEPAYSSTRSSSRIYRVTGHGAAPDEAISEAQARLMAVGAAQLDAQRKLAGLVTGTRIHAVNESADHVQTRYAVREEITALLQGVRTLSTRLNPDGVAEVDMELQVGPSSAAPHIVDLRGYQIERRDQDIFRAYENHASEPALTPRPSETAFLDMDGGLFPERGLPSSRDFSDRPGRSNTSNNDVIVGEITVEPPTGQSSPRGRYTDLVLDARGHGYTPVETPRAYLRNGGQIYPMQSGPLERYAPEKEPAIRHIRTLDEAERLDGYGGAPLIIPVDEVRDGVEPALILSRWSLLRLAPLLQSRLVEGEGYVLILTD